MAAGTGKGVFDGSVRVEQKAQKTDAGQLSRNLLLVPRATVNVKPNLQIVADDVKCTHGCAVSDLEEDQLFYFRQDIPSQMVAKASLRCACSGPGPELLAKAMHLGCVNNDHLLRAHSLYSMRIWLHMLSAASSFLMTPPYSPLPQLPARCLKISL